MITKSFYQDVNQDARSVNRKQWNIIFLFVQYKLFYLWNSKLGFHEPMFPPISCININSRSFYDGTYRRLI